MSPQIIFIFVFFFTFFSLEASTKKMVYIYAGPGVSAHSLLQTTSTMKTFFDTNYKIEHIFPEQIINDDWEKETALFIVPGGADIPYMRFLNGPGNQKIRSFVENGGSFLGICAGSYYGGGFVDFAKGTNIEVQGERELCFFPGIVKGPFLAPYDYKSEAGTRIANLSWKGLSKFEKNSIFSVYCNGGGYFVDAKNQENIEVLASYDPDGEFAALVMCRIGKGKAILSGPHFEYDPELLDHSDEYLQQIIPELKNGNEKRKELIQYLIKELTTANFP